MKLLEKKMYLFVVCREFPPSVFHVLEGGGKISEGDEISLEAAGVSPQGNFPGRGELKTGERD